MTQTLDSPAGNNTSAAPPSSTSPTTIATIVGVALGLGLVGPGTVITIMTIFFGPYLRRKLLQCGKPYTMDLNPQTLNSKPLTLNPKP